MKKHLQLILFCSLLCIMANDPIAAPLIPLGPFDITGTIHELEWIPEKIIRGIPGMSGSAGHDRIIPAHFFITLTDFGGVVPENAVAMTSYLDGSLPASGEREKKPAFLLLQLDHSDKKYLKRGMKIQVIGYTVKGDEGGTWTSYKKIRIKGRASLEDQIRAYLKNNIASPQFGGKMFCSHELFGSEKKGNKKYVYLWALCMEYYLKDGMLMPGSGSSMPLALIAVHTHSGEEKITEHQKPVDGEGYGESIRKIFPLKYHKAVFADSKEYNRRAETLLKDTEKQAEGYYHAKQREDSF